MADAGVAAPIRESSVGDSLRPLTISFPSAKKISGLGLTTLWKLAKEGRIEVVHVGRRALIIYTSLEKLLLRQSNEQPAEARGKSAKDAAS